MSTFKSQLVNEPIRAIHRADGTFILASQCHRILYDEDNNGVWYVLNTTKEIVPLVQSWIFVSVNSLAGIAFKEETYEEIMVDVPNRT
jgi:hypothetical protein